MFKNFKGRADVKNSSQVRSSAQRGFKIAFLKSFPQTEEIIDEIWPKKAQLVHLKCEDKINLYVIEEFPLFFQIADGPLIPSLRLFHQYPSRFDFVQVDLGAIKRVLSGANIMIPGLKSQGGLISENIKQGQYLAVKAQGKENALAIGKANFDSLGMQNLSTGIAVDNIHHLGDPLWKFSWN